jgi:hypothetical protein
MNWAVWDSRRHVPGRLRLISRLNRLGSLSGSLNLGKDETFSGDING